MADYSEFPTTPTAWQEQQWEAIAPLETEDRPQPERRRRPDLVSLIAGLLFLTFAVSVVVDIDVPARLAEGGVLWVLLIGAGIWLLVKELRKARRRG
ncbi:MAG TPA: hypothetical protein VD834_00075 [Blastococcus sp.]|nr:hypothetical protein [Blastococcus sp.]